MSSERRATRRRVGYARPVTVCQNRFEIPLVGGGMMGGHNIFVVEAMPRQGYPVPRSRTAKLLPFLERRFWVDQEDRQIVKVQVEVIDTISVGSFLVRVAKRSRAVLELKSVSHGIWLTDRLQVFASARLGLQKVLCIEQEVHYSRYSSVPADARAIQPVEGRTARLNQFAKATSP